MSQFRCERSLRAEVPKRKLPRVARPNNISKLLHLCENLTKTSCFYEFSLTSLTRMKPCMCCFNKFNDAAMMHYCVDWQRKPQVFPRSPIRCNRHHTISNGREIDQSYEPSGKNKSNNIRSEVQHRSSEVILHSATARPTASSTLCQRLICSAALTNSPMHATALPLMSMQLKCGISMVACSLHE